MDSEVHLAKFLFSFFLWLLLSSLSPLWKFPLPLLNTDLLTAWLSQQGSVLMVFSFMHVFIINEFGENEGHRYASFPES